MMKVVELSEVCTPDLFMVGQYMLGDGKGKWFVVDEDGTPYARYVDKADAEEYADTSNNPMPNNPYEHLTTDELIEEVHKFIEELKKD